MGVQPPDLETHELNVAIKYPEQPWFYAFDNSTYDHPNWENPAFRLDGEECDVAVRLRGVHLDQELRFSLRNPGTGASLELVPKSAAQPESREGRTASVGVEHKSSEHRQESTLRAFRGRRANEAAKEWRDLCERFGTQEQTAIKASHRLRDGDTRIYAERPDSDDPSDKWTIRSSDPDCRRDAELLCALAGVRLLSTGIETTLSADVRSIEDDTQRWLSFLKSLGEVRPPDLRIRGSGMVHGTLHALSYDSIDNLARASKRGSVDCERRAASA